MPQLNCPHCGGIHLGQRYDDCPFRKVSTTPQPTPLPELPRFQCHKIVRAAKILIVIRSEGKVSLDLEGVGGIEVSAEFDAKHHPTHGGYFVVYEDGYQSFSPAKAFEDGYTPI